MKAITKEINGRYYAFAIKRGNVYSIGNDCPKNGGQWYATGLSDKAIKYVATPSPSKQAAYQKAYRFNKGGRC